MYVNIRETIYKRVIVGYNIIDYFWNLLINEDKV